MRAALLEKPSELVVVDDIDIADPRAGQVLVRISHCGVCHSDLHTIDAPAVRAPTVLGHEAGGIIEKVGPGVSQFAEGDKVILTLRPVCGRCYFCTRGQPTLCRPAGGAGRGRGEAPVSHLTRKGDPIVAGIGLGAFAERVIASVNAAVKVPDDTPMEIAC